MAGIALSHSSGFACMTSALTSLAALGEVPSAEVPVVRP